MGQDIYDSPYPPDESLNPGTYRIFNPTAGTSIQMSYHDPTGVVTWENHGGENQQWFLQRAGHGYQLQNRRYGGYLAVYNTDNGGSVYASRYPTTWVFLKYNEDYIVQLADKNRVLDLDGCSSRNGNTPPHSFGARTPSSFPPPHPPPSSLPPKLTFSIPAPPPKPTASARGVCAQNGAMTP
ncbi:hypothetical protein RSOLAG1IB_05238 [Rhizoctonia solani AG-1 IB]|uniref:Ricin B lectin domain-containing protein n=1 Tax=Thanatephorus cucumeris (strain AG1-IB / isolate 7/3/14) TaxID=1108050 RepID=A0A0B7FZ30_THACB|nr:hypothetical protein RSOLAG1IB_05238 [Rhizoctonia solani AG-1 IB]